MNRPGQTRQSRYFQEISQSFIDLRGAPFILSSKDVMMISTWEETGIPLRVVLEGIRRAFEKYRQRHAGSRKIFSLSFCQAEVDRAFAGFRDRGVGRERQRVSRTEKAERARGEIERFLRNAPPEAGYLADVLRQALTAFSRRTPKEEELEKLEEKADDLILRRVSEEDREAARRRVEAEFAGRPKQEQERIVGLQLVKRAREKYRIPRLSLFYY
jgi:hypothetical protein